MDTLDEQAIALGLQRGERSAWHALYDAYSASVWRLVARLMGPVPNEIADVVQDVFLAAARSARTYDAAKGTLWLWLCGIARRHVALYYRHVAQRARLNQARARLATGDGHPMAACASAPLESAAATEISLLVRATLTELEAGYGAILAARYLDGASVDQIASAENCSEMAIRSKLARARRAFREAFERVIDLSGSAEETSDDA